MTELQALVVLRGMAATYRLLGARLLRLPDPGLLDGPLVVIGMALLLLFGLCFLATLKVDFP